MDLLLDAQTDKRRGVDLRLLEREQRLQQQISLKAGARRRQGITRDESNALEREIEQFRIELQQLQSEIKRSSPGSAAPVNVPELSVKDMQTKLLLLRNLGDAGVEIYSLAFSPDGRVLAGGTASNAPSLWNTETGAKLRALSEATETQDFLTSIAYNPQGKTLLTGSTDNTLRFRDANTGEQIGTPLMHANWVNAAAFSPDGALAITASRDGVVRAWHVKASN